jgi:ADP-ribose pyrophosphatase YjhB (NUDIX family)
MAWTLPAGFMENNETSGEAALRETLEEAGARVELGPMFTFSTFRTLARFT